MADLQPAYLIHGDDDVKLDAWRTRVRERAAREQASIELLHGERDSGEAVAMALSSLTLSMGRRYVVVDGIERWKDKDVVAIVAALAAPPPDTVVVLLGDETKDSPKKAWKAPEKLIKAVQKAGGEVTPCLKPKPAGFLTWIAERGAALDLHVDRDAAQALLERVGPEQRRLMRELEKIACYAPEGGRVDRDVVEALTVSDIEAKGYELADAVIDGDRAHALALAEDLRDRGGDIMHILYAMLRRARDMRRVWALLEEGASTPDIAAALRVPPFVAKRMTAQARGLDGPRLERIMADLAELDFAVRGGGNLDTETALTLTLVAAA
jgi:DNA polymerase-3 subunit delta